MKNVKNCDNFFHFISFFQEECYFLIDTLSVCSVTQKHQASYHETWLEHGPGVKTHFRQIQVNGGE